MAAAAKQSKWEAVKMLRHLLPEDENSKQQKQYLQRIAAAWAAQGNKDFVVWSRSLHRLGLLTLENMRIAARNGHFSLLRWFWENEPAKCPPLHELFWMAVVFADVTTLEWMVARGHQFDCAALAHHSVGNEPLSSTNNQATKV